MTTLQIIGLVLLVGGVLVYGALFLYVLTNDKRREKREAEHDAKKVHSIDGGAFRIFRESAGQHIAQ